MKCGYPVITWTPPTSSPVTITGYQVWRDSSTKRTLRFEESKVGPLKLPVANGTRTRSAQGRVLGSITRSPMRSAVQLNSTLLPASQHSYTDTDPALQSGQTYEYYIIAVAGANSTTVSSAQSNEVSFAMPAYPTIMPATSLTISSNAVLNVHLALTAPTTNNDGSAITALPGTFLIYRSTTLPANTATLSFNQINSTTFTLEGTQPWSNTQFNESVPNVPCVSYVVLAEDSNGRVAGSANASYPVWQIAPFTTGVILSVNPSNPTTLEVINQSTGAALDGTSPISTKVTAAVYQNAQLVSNQPSVLFSCSQQGGSFSPAAATSANASGQAVVTYQAGTVAGQVSLYATCGSVYLPAAGDYADAGTCR